MKKTVIIVVSIVCVTAIIITGLILGYDHIKSDRQFKFDIAKEIADIIAAEPRYLNAEAASKANYYFDTVYKNIIDTIDGQ